MRYCEYAPGEISGLLMGAGFHPDVAAQVDSLYQKYPNAFMGIEPISIGVALLGLGSSVAGFFGKKKDAEAAAAAAEIERIRTERAREQAAQNTRLLVTGAAILVPVMLLVVVASRKRTRGRGE